MCRGSMKSTIWYRLVKLARIDWAPPIRVEEMLNISFRSLRGISWGRIHWHITSLTLIWTHWREKSARILFFGWKSLEATWDLFYFSSSLSTSTNEAFLGISLSQNLLYWKLVRKITRLTKETLTSWLLTPMGFV